MQETVGRKIAGGRGARALPAWLAVGMLVTAAGAFAAELAMPASETSTSAAVFEMGTVTLPRFGNFDGSHRAQQRVDMALLSPGRSAFGVTVGITGLSPSRYGFSGAAPDATGSVNLGLQWRYLLENNRRIDVTAWRDLGRPNDALAMVQSGDAAYGARVEMQLSGPRSRFVADHGFIGMQLDGGGRIALRRSAGKPMVYYRNNF